MSRGGQRRTDPPLSFEAVLAPCSLDQFRSESLGKSPLHLRGPHGRFRRLLDWDGLSRLLETCPLEPPRLRIVKSGKTIPPERYLRHLGEMVSIDGGALSLLFRDGATAVINVIDDLVPAIATLADEIGDCLGGRPSVNAYATWGDEAGLTAHSDYHDVLVLQLAGSKQWAIHRPTRTDPLRDDAFEPPSPDTPPYSVETLGDGDVLYLPRGWIHAPVPVGEPSLHLTISITYPTGAGFLEWVSQQLRSDPRVRAAVPQQDPNGLAHWKDELAGIVAEAIGGNAVERYLRHKLAQRTARPRFSFSDFGRLPPTEWDDSTILRPASQHCFVVEIKEDGGGALVAMGRSLPCSSGVAAALAGLSSTKPIALGDLKSGLTTEEAAELGQLLAMLSTFGLLETKRG